jgi:ribonucleotide reductase alpha subunit
MNAGTSLGQPSAALEISPEQHVRVQAAFQKHVDNAVSKTVNLAGDALPSVVAAAYRFSVRTWMQRGNSIGMGRKPRAFFS